MHACVCVCVCVWIIKSLKGSTKILEIKSHINHSPQDLRNESPFMMAPLKSLKSCLKKSRAFSCYVIGAMLEGKNNTFSLHWEIRYIPCKTVSLFPPSSMATVETLYKPGVHLSIHSIHSQMAWIILLYCSKQSNNSGQTDLPKRRVVISQLTCLIYIIDTCYRVPDSTNYTPNIDDKELYECGKKYLLRTHFCCFWCFLSQISYFIPVSLGHFYSEFTVNFSIEGEGLRL